MPKKSGALDERVLQEPALNLTGWVLSEAARAAEQEGFGWKAVPDPPLGFASVLDAYQRCRETRERYPVAMDGSITSIYAGSEANHAFSFLHDMTHIRLQLGFDPDAELYVAVEHLNMLRRSGFTVGSLEWHLLHADTVGQLVAGCVLDRFVHNQRAFVFDCVMLGLKRATELEAARDASNELTKTV